MEPLKTDKDTAKPVNVHEPVNPTVAPLGVPGFRHKRDGGDGPPLAGMELDTDAQDERAHTGTGDQPGNTEGSRFATPSDEKAEPNGG